MITAWAFPVPMGVQQAECAHPDVDRRVVLNGRGFVFCRSCGRYVVIQCSTGGATVQA